MRTSRLSFPAWLATIVGAVILAAPSAHAVSILYSNDVQGELEPCGCRENPYGGLVRKAGWIARMRDEPIVQLDGGNLLFNAEAIPEALADQAETQARFLLDGLKLLKHDAAVPGPKDLALGTRTFERITRKSGVSFLAANLFRKGGGRWLPASAVFTRRGSDGKPVRIAVIGLVGDQWNWPSDLKVSAPIPIARRLVPELRRKADWIVALTHQGLEADQKLAAEVPGIDLIIGGGTQSFLQEPAVVKRANGETTRIYQSSFRNQYVGRIPLTRPFSNEGHSLTGLDPAYETSTPAWPTQETIRKLVDAFKADVARINSARIQEDHARLTRVGAGARSGATIQSLPRCAECHWKQFDFWRRTKHADALTPLLAKSQIRNKECLSCHTVGFGDASQGWTDVSQLASVRSEPGQPLQPLEPEELQAYFAQLHSARSLDAKVKLARVPSPLPLRDSLGRFERSFAPVQCENCHGNGGDHPVAGAITRNPAQETCLKCHTAETAPKWYTAGNRPDEPLIQKKRAQVACPAGELVEP